MNKKALAAVLLFCITVLVYVAPVRDWRFWWDDYGAAQSGCIKSCEDAKAFFSSRPNDLIVLPSNTREGRTWTFLGVMYRPLALLKYAAQMLAVGPDKPYLIFIATIVLHALAALVVFWLFLMFLPLVSAFVGSLFFALHPTVGGWIGQICCQGFHLTVICLGLAILLLKSAVDRTSISRLFGALTLFAIPLWMHELAIVFPFWLSLAAPLYFYSQGVRKGIIRKVVYWIGPFYLVLVMYLLIRVLTYPLVFGADNLIFDPRTFVGHLWSKIRYFDFIDMFKDLIGLNWLPRGYRVIKLAIFTTVVSAVAMLFGRSSKKKWIAVLLAGAIMFYWLSFIWSHRARYAYPAIPFFAAALLLAVSDTRKVRHFLHAFLLVISFVGAVFGVHTIRQRVLKCVVADQALADFVSSRSDLCDIPVFFVGVPVTLFPQGIVQGLWLHRGSNAVPAFYEPMLNVCSAKDVRTDGYERVCMERPVEISLSGKTLKLHSNNTEFVWFPQVSLSEIPPCSMGFCRVRECKYYPDKLEYRAYDVTLDLADKWCKRGMAVVTWDFVNQRFDVLGVIPQQGV